MSGVLGFQDPGRGIDAQSPMAKIEESRVMHDLHVWTLTSGVNEMSAHVIVTDGGQRDVAVPWKARPCWAALTIVARRSVDLGNRACAFRRQLAGSSSPLARIIHGDCGTGRRRPACV
jgi:hypothetical protein